MKTTAILGGVLIVSMLALSSSLSAQSSAERIESSKSPQGKVSARISKQLDGRGFQLSLSGEKVMGLSIDGKVVDPSNWDTYASQIAELKAQLKKDEQRVKSEMVRSLAAQKESLAERDKSLKVKMQTLEVKSAVEQTQIKIEKEKKLAEEGLAKADAAKAIADAGRVKAEAGRQAAEADRKLLDELITELVSDQIIGAKQELTSLQPESSGMRVNGKLQSEAISGKYVKKYPSLVRTGANYNFGVSKAK